MVYNFFNKKTQSGTRENMNEEELQDKNYINQLLKNSKEGKSMPVLKIIFALQVWLTGKSLSSRNGGNKYISYVIDVFTKYTCVKPLKDKKAEAVLYGFIKRVTNLNINQINYELIKKVNFITTYAKLKND